MKVLLPQPLGPLIATNSCAAISTDTPSNACTTRSPLLYSRVSSRAEIIAGLSASGPDGANRRAADFGIIDETDDYIAVDKPPFLLVHPTRPDGARTLWGEVRNLLAYEIANGGQVSIVNRLDRETSGVVLIAKTAAAARNFGLLMQEGKLHKEYLAIVWGWPEWDRQTVDAPLGRQGSQGPTNIWLKQTIHPAGTSAVTDFVVERRFTKDTAAGNKFAMVRALPRTGRTHQIRVHLASLGLPVVGDKIYGPDEQHYLEFIQTGWTDALAAKLLLPRHALHSTHLSVGGRHSWESPLPVDLQSWLSEN